jgi:hypothetical protein
MRNEHYSVLNAADHQLQQQTFQKYDEDAVAGDEYKCWSRQKRAYVEINMGDWVFIRKGEFAGAEGKVIAKHRQGIEVDCYLNKKDLKTETGSRLSTTLSLGTFSVNEDLDVVLGKTIVDVLIIMEALRRRKNQSQQSSFSLLNLCHVPLLSPIKRPLADVGEMFEAAKHKKRKIESEKEAGGQQNEKWPEHLAFLSPVLHAMRKDQPLTEDMKRSILLVTKADKTKIVNALPAKEGEFFWHELKNVCKQMRAHKTKQTEIDKETTVFQKADIIDLTSSTPPAEADVASLLEITAKVQMEHESQHSDRKRKTERAWRSGHEVNYKCYLVGCDMDREHSDSSQIAMKQRSHVYNRHMKKHFDGGERFDDKRTQHTA